MLCEECNINEATVSVSVIVNGESTIRRLCHACMKKKSLDLVRGNLGSFLGSVLAVMNDHRSSSSDMAKACSKCGLTWTEFKKTGHLGCSDCYDAFADELKPVLQKIHGCAQHIGRTPDMLQNEPKYILFQTM